MSWALLCASNSFARKDAVFSLCVFPVLKDGQSLAFSSTSLLLPSQHTAAHYSTLQHAATHCKHTATRCSTLQHIAARCNTLQTHCKTLQHIANTQQIHCKHTTNTSQHTTNTLQHTTNTLQHTVTYCNAIQRTATYCNVLQLSTTHFRTSACARCLSRSRPLVPTRTHACALLSHPLSLSRSLSFSFSRSLALSPLSLAHSLTLSLALSPCRTSRRESTRARTCQSLNSPCKREHARTLTRAPEKLLTHIHTIHEQATRDCQSFCAPG